MKSVNDIFREIVAATAGEYGKISHTCSVTGII